MLEGGAGRHFYDQCNYFFFPTTFLQDPNEQFKKLETAILKLPIKHIKAN